MKKLVFAISVALSLLYSDVSFCQSSKELSELKEELSAVKGRQIVIERQLQVIKDILQAKQAPTAPPQAVGPTLDSPIVVSLEGAAIRGDKNAIVTVIEFTDYQCPFCSRFFRDTMPQIENDYVKSGKIQYALREFPLESIHPLAFKAAEAASCSGEQGKYWEMHDRLFANQNTLAAQHLFTHADVLGLDTGKFKICLESGKYVAKVRRDLTDAQKAGINGTPTFFIGLTDPKGIEIKAVAKIVGAQNYLAFKTAIDALLAQQ
jgi:protein-disulfide isomerase